MKEMLRTLLVLMWMHLKVRLRRFVHTPIEILSPSLLFIIIISLKPYLLPISRHESYTPETIITQNEIDTIDFSSIAYSRILYYPDSPAAKQLMNEFEMKRGYKYKVSDARPFSNLSEISEKNYSTYVLFENMKGFDLPDHLEYTIRMPPNRNFETYTYQCTCDIIESHFSYGRILYGEFTTLQWLIDTSYIGLKSNKTLPQTVDFQEFPKLSEFNNGPPLMIEIFIYICIFSLLLPFVFLMSRLLEERASGIQELMKLNGLSNGLLALSHALNALPGGLAYCVAGACLVTYAPRSCAGLVFVTLLLHYVTVVALAFVCRYIVDSTAYTTTLSVVVYGAASAPAIALAANGARLPPVGALAGLLPHVPVCWLWKEMRQLEFYNVGLTLAGAARSHSASSFSVLLGMLFLVIQAALLVLLAWYLSLVRPGKHGQALPYNFLFKRQYWKVRPDEAGGEEEDEAPITRDPRYFEEAPRDAEVGIKIVNVSKQFPKQRALSNVSLDVYSGEITVLLGHNGAGKTTLMSIITGMLRATEGKVFVGGLDTATQLRAARRQLGLCTQHNLFFPDLTVLEHVMFFTLIKGGTFAAARSSSLALAARLGLGEKRASKAAQLSGGMQRRLQLACALAGEARVLVLDEPTSGLDVETRRQLWDLLLSLRGSRTILLSTHFMEEADALGDRVAALHAGRLRCHASTMHLKRALGTGYRLSLTLASGAAGEAQARLVAAVQRHVPAAALLEREAGGALTLGLPAAASGAFPALFAALEAERAPLGLRAIGVGRSTLEEVFLKLCSDVDTTPSEDAADGAAVPEPTLKTVTGCTLYLRQIWVLLMRQIKYIWSKKISFLIMQLLLPLVIIGFLSRLNHKTEYRRSESRQNVDIALNLDLYDGLSNHKVLYNVGEEYPISYLKEMYPKFQFVETRDVAQAITDIAVDVFEYEKYLVGVEFNGTYAKVMYTTVYMHAAPVALSLLSNLVALGALPGLRPRPPPRRPLITAHNHPLPEMHDTLVFYDHDRRGQDPIPIFVYVIVLVFFVMSVLVNAVTLPCRERASGARRLHVMAGCAPALHWAATLAAHWALYAALLAAPAVGLAAALADADALLHDALGELFVVLVFGIAALLPFAYFVSMFVQERAAAALIIACVFVFGVCTPAVWLSRLMNAAVDEGLLRLVNVLMPPHAFSAAAIGLVVTAMDRNNNVRDLSYFRVKDLQTGAQLIIMTFQLVFYMALTILSEMGLFNYLYERLTNSRYPLDGGSVLYDETPIRAERDYVAYALDRPAEPAGPDALLAHDLHKNYVKIIGKSCNAVKGISFSIKKGECFGILGVNGAGKSTTFKMLTAEETATRGRARCATRDLRPLRAQKYLNTMSYCPQFFGLDKFLTGRENLELVLTLRGLSAAAVAAEADAWIDVVGLQKYASRPVSAYSGGCSRRLACAAALCLRAGAALLDEPSAGVDVAARRRMWAAVRRAQRRGAALLVCSHSMDEMEALCARIAIMSRGRVAALGSAGELRAAHAAGHAVQVKLRQSAPAQRRASAGGDETDDAKMMIDRFKSELKQNFDCTLKDEHKTMLHYHINQTMSYSDLFERMERLKGSFPGLVEDYSVTETTLEEVFLSFAQDKGPAHDGGPAAV